MTVSADIVAVLRGLDRTDGGAGAGGVLRDRLGVTDREAKHLSQVSRKLEEMPNTRGNLRAGEITLVNATALAAARNKGGNDHKANLHLHCRYITPRKERGR